MFERKNAPMPLTDTAIRTAKPAHSVPDALGTAYNRTRFLKERKAMMQAWADYLDRLKAGADVIPLRGTAV
jgi:hypothetical protein